MLYFYFNGQQEEIVNAPVFTSALDDTLKNGELMLSLRSLQSEIEPRTKVQIIDDSGNIIYSFVVKSDSVEVVSKEEFMSYLHKIEVIEDISELDFYSVRDTIITQPANNKVSCYFSVFAPFKKAIESETGIYYVPSCNSQSFTLSKKAKIKNAYIKVHIYEIDTEITPKLIESETSIENVSVNLNANEETYEIVSGKTFTNGETLEIAKYYFSGGGAFKIESVIINDNIYDSANDNKIISCELILEYYYYTLYDVLKELKEQVALEEK